MFQEITPKELKARLDAGEDLQIIDVREDWELKTVSLPNVTHIPMGDISDAMDDIPMDKPVVLMCHHGNRSSQVALWLAMQGYENLLNLTGGIERWANEVDPSLPHY